MDIYYHHIEISIEITSYNWYNLGHELVRCSTDSSAIRAGSVLPGDRSPRSSFLSSHGQWEISRIRFIGATDSICEAPVYDSVQLGFT